MDTAVIVQRRASKKQSVLKEERPESPHMVDKLEHHFFILISSDRSTNLANTIVTWQIVASSCATLD